MMYVCMNVNLDYYRWRNNDRVNLWRRILDWVGLIWIYGFKKFVELVVHGYEGTFCIQNYSYQVFNILALEWLKIYVR